MNNPSVQLISLNGPAGHSTAQLADIAELLDILEWKCLSIASVEATLREHDNTIAALHGEFVSHRSRCLISSLVSARNDAGSRCLHTAARPRVKPQ